LLTTNPWSGLLLRTPLNHIFDATQCMCVCLTCLAHIYARVTSHCMCDMPHIQTSCMGECLVGDVSLYVWHASLICMHDWRLIVCVTCLIYKCHVWVTSHCMCDMPHIPKRNAWVTSHCMCDMHDWRLVVTYMSHTWFEGRSKSPFHGCLYMWHVAHAWKTSHCMCDMHNWRLMVCEWLPPRTRISDMTHLYMWHDSLYVWHAWSHVWNASLMDITHLSGIWPTLCVTCVTLGVTFLTHGRHSLMWNMTQSYTWHDILYAWHAW